MSPIAYGIPVLLEHWALTLAFAFVALVAVEGVFWVGVRVVRRAARRSAMAVTVTQAIHGPSHWVLRLVALGHANKEVAENLSLTEETVKVHMRTILGKLSAKDRTHAVTIALKRGIIEL